MKAITAAVILFGFSAYLSAHASQAASCGTQKADGILKSVENAEFTAEKGHFLASRKDHHAPVELTFTDCQGLGVNREDDQWWVLPISVTGAQIKANSGLWILPSDAQSKDDSWYLELHGGDASAIKSEAGLRVLLNADSFTAIKAEARPHSDPFNHRFSFKFSGGAELENALAGFYWAPCCHRSWRRPWRRSFLTAVDMF